MSSPDCSLCQICFLPYNDKAKLPKILLCGHTLCLSCLNSIPKSQNRVKCPTCRELMAPNQAFPTNYIVLKLTGESAKSQEIMCRHHPDYKADHFCLSDKQRVCLFCKVYGEHRDHDMVHVGELKLNLEKGIADTKRNLEKKKKSLTDFCEFYEEINLKLIESIGSKYDELIKCINELKIKTTKKIYKTFYRTIENMQSHETYQKSLKVFDSFEKEVAELRSKGPEEFVTSAFTFTAQISERFPEIDCSELDQNHQKSENFFTQALKTFDEQTKNSIDQLTNNSKVFKDSLSTFHLCCEEHAKTIIFIQTQEGNGPLKIKVKPSITLEDIRQRLVAKGKCRSDALFYDQNETLLQMRSSIAECNLSQNSQIVVKYANPAVPQG